MAKFWDWFTKGAPVPPPSDPDWVESVFTPYEPGAVERARSGAGSRPSYAAPPRPVVPSGVSARVESQEKSQPHKIPWGDPEKFFNLSELWALIRQNRDADFIKKAKACKGDDDEAILPLAQIVAPGEKRNLKLFKFFNLPLEEARKRVDLDPWEDWVEPYLSDLEKKLMKLMPEDIAKYDGVLEFGETGDGAFGLLYWECEGE